MKLPIISASKRHLLARCQAPFRGDMPWSETSGRAAIDGTKAHLAVHKRDASLAPKRLRNAVGHAISFLAAFPEAMTEVAVGYDLDTGEKLVLDGVTDRAYPERFRVAGTIDAVLPASVPTIIDWKFGSVHADEYAAQMSVLGYLSESLFGEWSPKTKIAYCGDEGIAWVEVPWKWETEHQRLEDDMAKIESAWPEPGSWCGWCPCKAACPSAQVQTYRRAS